MEQPNLCPQVNWVFLAWLIALLAPQEKPQHVYMCAYIYICRLASLMFIITASSLVEAEGRSFGAHNMQPSKRTAGVKICHDLLRAV